MSASPKRNSAARKRTNPKVINLALQGGGSHGAFTWGVLDRLLEDARIHIESISGTSAGAMNAVVLADGITRGGRDGARQALQDFWAAVAQSAVTSPIQRSAWDVLHGQWSLDSSPSYLFFDLLSRVASPYELNPLNLNPLHSLVSSQVDFERVRHCNKIKLFISATQVRTGRVKVFENDQLSADTVMASACIPTIFQAVEIDGEAYWDGAFMGNPVLFPFIYKCESRDIVIVQINPLVRDEIPTNARDILERMNEITFNASLMKEFRAIDFVGRLIDEGSLDESRYKRLLVHIIHAENQLASLGASSKLNAEWEFLEHLKNIGRNTADEWLASNFNQLGKQSTVDLRPLYSSNVPDPAAEQ